MTNYFHGEIQQGRLPTNLHRFGRGEWEVVRRTEMRKEVGCMVVNEANFDKYRVLTSPQAGHGQKLHLIPHCSDPVTLLP